MTPLFWILGGLAFIILASGFVTFWMACRPAKEPDWTDEAQVMKSPQARFYPQIRQSIQWLQEVHAQTITTQSRDGLTLSAWWIPAEKPRGTILLAHGYHSVPYVDFGPAMAFYHGLGLNLLIPAQRCHGASQGRFITFGVRESEDMACWLDYHQRLCQGPVILSGMSMGATTVLYMADQELPGDVRGIIADCGFTSPREILSHVFKGMVHVPAGPSVFVADLFARLLAGFSLDEKHTCKALAKSRVPVFMIHGQKDDFVPWDMTRRGFEACTSEKMLLLVPGADHGMSFLKDRERYRNMLLEFIDRYLEESI